MTEKAKSPSMKLMKAKPKAAAEVTTDDAQTLVAEAETEQEVAVAKVAEQATAEAVDTSEATSIKDDETDLIVMTAHEVENLKEDKAFKMVPALLDSTAQGDFKLGGVLSVIQAQGWYMDRGYENFRSYVESECGLNYRKAMYLISIYNGLVESGVKWEQVKHLGWTKLKELSSILTSENVADWVAKAEEMTVLQLQEYIKAQSAGSAVGGDEPTTKDAKKTTTMTFKLHEDQKQTVKEALAKAKHETGTSVDTVALEHICLDFLGGQSKLAKMPTLEELMKDKSAEEVLSVFGEMFPDVEITATLPE